MAVVMRAMAKQSGQTNRTQLITASQMNRIKSATSPFFRRYCGAIRPVADRLEEDALGKEALFQRNLEIQTTTLILKFLNFKIGLTFWVGQRRSQAEPQDCA